MSAKDPEWYELKEKRWTEMSEKNEYGKSYRSFRDSQRQKLYDAEDRFRSIIRGDKKLKIYITLEQIQAYVNKILKSAWVVRRWGVQKHITIYEHTCCDANTYKCRIRLSKWGWNQVVVLHELAHLLSDWGTSHGRHFARSFLELIGHELGEDARKQLKEQFKIRNVKSTPIPNYSEETKVKMKARGKALAAKYLVKV